MRSAKALKKLLDQEFQTVLDLGSGSGDQARALREAGKSVTTIALSGADICADYNAHEFEQQFDAIWCSHVLEHQINVNDFLLKVFRDLKEGGWLAITVPPMKHEIVGGHVTLWNAGLLLYNLILAGFNCSAASVWSEGYDVSVVVRKVPAVLPKLSRDAGDIEALAGYFPIQVSGPFNGNIKEANW